MPTIFTHMALPLAIGVGLGRKAIPKALLVSGLVLSVLPDLDVLPYRLGIPFAAARDHRGYSHSLLFAAIAALLGAAILRRLRIPLRQSLWFLFLAAISHGLLDTMTTGGRGIALLWPWSETRFFSPVRFIKVAPLKLSNYFSINGVVVCWSEIRWVWLPSAFLGCSIALLRIRGYFATVSTPIPLD